MLFLATEEAKAGRYPLVLRHYQSLKDVTAAGHRFAILSHTWGSDEVLYADVVAERGAEKAGFTKVVNAIKQARDDRYALIWVDNCCINKDSSAELSEAINSMYAWYGAAAKCYAHLADVVYEEKTDSPQFNSAFCSSRWFQRGWTLQELLAPSDLVFYDRGWKHINDKVHLKDAVAKAARIRTDILTGQRSVNSASVAERMSWAAGRDTTRTEDKAYCLMGLFSVNMPMLYGESERAFQRLQEEIMKVSDDHSLFAWMSKTLKPGDLHGLLADSPDDFAFAEAPDIRAYSSWEKESPYAMTNRGLDIELHLSARQNSDQRFNAALHCPSPSGQGSFLAVVLQKLGSARDDDRYARVECHRLHAIGERGMRVAIYVPQALALQDEEGEYPLHVFKLDDLPAPYVYLQTEKTERFGGGDERLLPEVKSNRYVKVVKVAGTVAALLTIKDTATDTELYVRLGSAQRLTVGFNVVNEAGPDYIPLPPGRTAELPMHYVRIDMPERVFAGVKIYIVQFTIQRRQSALAARIAEGAADGLARLLPPLSAVSQSQEQEPQHQWQRALEPKPRSEAGRKGFLRNVGLRR